jgi:hypothetical protein
MTRSSHLRLHTRPPAGGTCCRCGEPFDSADLAVFVPGLLSGGWAHRNCLRPE